ncbi:MAG: hypothetical protein M1831_004037 [Alyxoria varia]|nr:MAG: hypothetical protein M1831_004037 [Alyxoria varia]
MELSSSAKISQLASAIATNAERYHEYLASLGVSPSIRIDRSSKFDLPLEIVQAREIVLESSSELQALLLGPIGYLQKQCLEHSTLISIQAIYRFGIATSFAVNEEVTYEHIASNTGLTQGSLKRLLRHAMTKHIFQERRKGAVSHTASSQALAENKDFRDWVGMVCEEMWPSAARVVDAMTTWPESEEPNHTGFAYANRTGNDIFTELRKNPARSERFANAMNMLSAVEGFEIDALLQCLSPNELESKVFVDVGGSHGAASIAVARHCHAVNCIVQDLSDVVSEGVSTLPRDVEDRVTFMSHDFFNAQPVKGADIYFLRWVLHDWSDKYCVRILQALIPALNRRSRLIVSEFVLPSPGTGSRRQEWLIRAFDLSMLELFNGQERDEDDWRQLIHKADTRFELVSIKRPEKSKLSFIEIRWNDGSLDLREECQ